MDYYKINCQKCKISTKHSVVNISIRAGLKLRCLNCGHTKERYHKANVIEKNKMEKENDNT